MKAKLISIIAIILLGVLALGITISNYTSVEMNYNTYLAKARSNAANQLPYNAYNYYKSAFGIRCDSELIYKEYLEQARLLGGRFYSSAITEYVEYFPMSAEAYETLCKFYYDEQKHSQVLETALAAREKGVATETVKNLYNECAYMYRTVRAEIQEPQSFLGGVALVKVEEKYGYLRENGNFLLAPLYFAASPMFGTSAAVNDGTEWHIINDAGYKIARTDERIDYAGIAIGNKIPVSKDGKYAYATAELRLPQEFLYDYASNFKNGVAAVKKGEKWALINAQEQQITDYVFDDIVLDEFDTCCNAGVIFVKKDGKYYMANPQGGKITEQAFDDVRPFVSAEPAAVCISGKWGFIDTAGQIVIEPQYENAKSFNIGIGAICVDGLWGYINNVGTQRIKNEFEDCLSFSANGITAVKEKGEWKYIRLLPYCN